MASSNEDKRVWTRKDIVTLIEMYETLPELWDNTRPEYKDRQSKMVALKKMSEAFNASTDELRRKIHNLRCQFSSEMRKIKKKSIEHNIDENMIYSEWQYFENLKFLIGLNNSTEKITIKVDNTDSLQYSSESEGFESYQDEPSTSTTSSVRQSTINKTEKIFIPSNDLGVRQKNKRSDEDHNIFGQYVASELRNLNDRNAKRLKLMIKKAIFEVTEEEFNLETSIECNFKGLL